MTHLRSIALLFALAGCAALAQATSITYNVTGATTSRGTLTGTVDVDTATNLVTAANLTLNASAFGSPIFTTVSSSATYNGLTQAYVSDSSFGPENYGGQVALFFDTAKTANGQLSICTSVAVCGTQAVEPSLVQMYSTHGNLTYDLSGGTLAPPSSPQGAQTPEPSSLVLLGTGMVSVAGLMLFWPGRIGRRSHAAKGSLVA